MWKYIDEIDVLPEVNCISCDTRDFHILCYDDIIDNIDLNVNDDVKYRKSEILGYLKSLESNSGGKGEWRYLSFVHDRSWYKYIRFIKTNEKLDSYGNKESVYIGYCIVNGKIVYLNRNLYDPDNIDFEYLNFIK